MRGAITFQPLAMSLTPSLLAGIVECHDCGTHKTMQYALMHGWRTVERDVSSTTSMLDYLCAECCETRVHDYNQVIADQTDDVN